MNDNEMNLLYQRLLERANKPGNFTSDAGLVVTELTKHRAVGTLHTSLKTCNPRNIIHGGAMFSIMDQLAGLAACTTGLTCVTINATIDYLRSAPPESDLLCEAVVVKAGKRVTMCEAKIFCGDKLIAKGSFAYCTMEPLAEALD